MIDTGGNDLISKLLFFFYQFSSFLRSCTMVNCSKSQRNKMDNMKRQSDVIYDRDNCQSLTSSDLPYLDLEEARRLGSNPAWVFPHKHADAVCLQCELVSKQCMPTHCPHHTSNHRCCAEFCRHSFLILYSFLHNPFSADNDSPIVPSVINCITMNERRFSHAPNKQDWMYV